jgi:hypothetical protein
MCFSVKVLGPPSQVLEPERGKLNYAFTIHCIAQARRRVLSPESYSQWEVRASCLLTTVGGERERGGHHLRKVVGPDVLCSHPPWWLTHITSTTASPTLLPRPDVALLCAAASKGKGQFSCFHDYLGPDLLTMLAPTHMADEWWDQLSQALALGAGSPVLSPNTYHHHHSCAVQVRCRPHSLECCTWLGVELAFLISWPCGKLPQLLEVAGAAASVIPHSKQVAESALTNSHSREWCTHTPTTTRTSFAMLPGRDARTALRDNPMFSSDNMSHGHQHWPLLVYSHGLMALASSSGYDLTMVPGSRAGHSQQSSTLKSPFPSLFLMLKLLFSFSTTLTPHTQTFW